MKGYNTDIIKNALKRVGWLTRTPGVCRFFPSDRLAETKKYVLNSYGNSEETSWESEIRPAMWITLDGN